jgi:hypothetical protein
MNAKLAPSKKDMEAFANQTPVMMWSGEAIRHFGDANGPFGQKLALVFQ